MLVIPIEKLKDSECYKRGSLLRDIFGNQFYDSKHLTKKEEIEQLIILYSKGIILDILEFMMFIKELEPLKFYKLMLVLTQNNKHNKQVFINEWGTLEDERSEINLLLKK